MPATTTTAAARTPGRPTSACSRAGTSTPVGAPSMARLTESFSRPQVDHRITTTITRLTSGSTTDQPVIMISPPARTTPSDTPASAIMCR